MTTEPRRLSGATILGILALLMWASLVAVARGVREHMGVLPSAAAANLVAGTLGLIAGRFRPGYLRSLFSAPRRYLLGCGSLFVIYNLALFPAIDRAASPTQTIEIALVNYLWPALSLAFAVPLLGKRAHLGLWPGLLVATAGAALAISGGSISWSSFSAGIASNPWPYLLALVAAVSWGLYSALSGRWGPRSGAGGVPLFLVATGAVLLVACWVHGDSLRGPETPRAWAELAYFALFPTLLAYVFWDVAMRRGNVILVASLSFFTVLFSTLISCAYLHVPMRRDFWLASLLVVAGAIICRRSVRDS
jgi:drug/metabolite transporter (DMT)-like permease